MTDKSKLQTIIQSVKTGTLAVTDAVENGVVKGAKGIWNGTTWLGRRAAKAHRQHEANLTQRAVEKAARKAEQEKAEKEAEKREERVEASKTKKAKKVVETVKAEEVVVEETA